MFDIFVFENRIEMILVISFNISEQQMVFIYNSMKNISTSKCFNQFRIYF